ncbi:MAG: biotin/lipoate A/B protein ligase family protein [Halanaeroarchaeum sp.]
MARSEPEWRLVGEETRPGPLNMALDEIAARTVAAGGPRTVRVYRWSPSTLSLGYGQSAASVDWDRCEHDGIDVTRRPTGGGGIYHDEYGDISYTIVVPAAEVPGDLMESYETLMEPVFDAFDRMGVDASYVADDRPAIHEPACYLRALHPAHDVVVGGKKISGNAQYRQRDVVIQHGSLSYALDPATHLGVFAAPETSESAFRKRITSIREAVGIGRDTAVNALISALRDWANAEPGSWSRDELTAAKGLAEEKYRSRTWNRDRVDPTD